jgi:hypothetical protein
VELWGGSNNDIQDRHRDMVCVCICKTPTLLCYDVGLVPVVMMAEDPLFSFFDGSCRRCWCTDGQSPALPSSSSSTRNNNRKYNPTRHFYYYMFIVCRGIFFFFFLYIWYRALPHI